MEYSKYFEKCSKIISNERFYRISDDAPSNLKTFMFDLHTNHFFGVWPNEWIYAISYLAFSDLEENIDYDSYEADIYNTDLCKWLYDNCNSFAHQYCIEAQEANPSTDLLNIISSGQWLAMHTIYEAVREFLTDNEVKND